MPHEVALFGVLFSPLIPACLAGFAVAALAAVALVRLDWLRFFVNPAWVVAAIGVIAVCLLSMTVWPLTGQV